MSAPPIRVLIADDHALVLEGMRALVEGEADLTVVATTTDATQVLPLVESSSLFLISRNKCSILLALS